MRHWLGGHHRSANAQRVGEKTAPLIAHAQPSVVVIDCSALTDLEYTALKALTEAEERARRDGITLWLAALNPEVRDVVEHAPLGQTLGHDRMLFNLEAAVEQYAHVASGEFGSARGPQT
jgi:anti-anti-sigma regulatory factor